LDRVVVFKANRDDEAGGELMEALGAHGIPHFFAFNDKNEPMGRWRGFGEPEEWLSAFDQATSDTASLEAKAEACRSAPSESTAAVLGRARSAADARREAVSYFRDAVRLAGRPVGEYAWEIFYNTFRGLEKHEFTVDDAKTAAAEAVATPSSPATPLYVALLMSQAAEETNDPSLLQPWLGRAMEAGRTLTDPEYDGLKTEIALVDALQVRKDAQAAHDLKVKSLDAGWETDADELNGLAWWLFENKIELPAARRYARRGIELAKDGKQKAMILDTEAEIENALGDPERAATLSAEAAQLDPANEIYKDQEARFRALVKKKG